MTERLPRLVPAELDQTQRAVYDAIAGGDRARGVQHFPLTGEDGSLNGPFGIMLHSPGTGAALQELGTAIRYRTDLSARVREIAILMVATATGSAFEWWAHERVGRAVGLTESELHDLAGGHFASADPVEQAATGLCSTLLGSAVLDDAAYAEIVDTLGAAAVIDLTTLVGYYRTLADLLAVFAVGPPTP